LELSSSVELMASVDLKLGRVSDRLTALEKYFQRPHLGLKLLPASVQVAAPTAPALLDFGACPDGIIWGPELFTFFFVDPWTAAANVTVAVFVGQPPLAGSGQVRPADCVVVNVPIPSTNNFASKRPAVRAKQHLFALVSGTGFNALTGTIYGNVGVTYTIDDPDGTGLTWI
jgi:hypothetical protein